MKKLLLILAIMSPAAHAMYHRNTSNNAGTSMESLEKEIMQNKQEIKDLKEALENQQTATITNQATLTTLTCCCFWTTFYMFNQKMNSIAKNCQCGKN
jgi:hypothetical protein